MYLYKLDYLQVINLSRNNFAIWLKCRLSDVNPQNNNFFKKQLSGLRLVSKSSRHSAVSGKAPQTESAELCRRQPSVWTISRLACGIRIRRQCRYENFIDRSAMDSEYLDKYNSMLTNMNLGIPILS